MGIISCEMNFIKPPGSVYKQGEIVSGVIRYTVHEPVEIQKITTSLKGIGNLELQAHRGSKNRFTYKTSEVLVDIDNIVQDEKIEMSDGSREIKFNFTLPDNITSTAKICKSFGTFKATCVIKYYIRIKLEGPGLISVNKHFRKEISVISEVALKLSRNPVIYAKTKKLVRLFPLKNGTINIKANILNSALPFGGKIAVHYEVENKSHVVVKSVLTKLMEGYTFKAEGRSEVTYEEDVPDTEAKTTSIESNNTLTEIIDIQLPRDKYCLVNSKIVSRHYFLRISAELPIPHGTIVLNIPVQIGVSTEENTSNDKVEKKNENTSDDDPPPSYWEVMSETKKDGDGDGIDDDDDENDKGKS